MTTSPALQAPQAATTPTPTPTAAPTPTPSSPTAPPPPVVTSPPPPPPPPSTTFPIVPLTARGASGSVVVTLSGNVARYHLDVTGLAPGSVHTIHDHLGACSRAAATPHLTVLTTMAADSTGAIVADVTVPAADAGPNRIVIVYSTGSATVVTGCADL
jgi:hypothetical protein